MRLRQNRASQRLVGLRAFFVLFCVFISFFFFFPSLLTVLKGAKGFMLCILRVHILILQWGGLGRRRVRV